MPKLRRLIPMGVLAPDAKNIDTEALKNVRNLLPVFGGYRSCPGLDFGPELASPLPITGTHAHLVSPRDATQRQSADSTRSNNTFEIIGIDENGDPYNQPHEVLDATAQDVDEDSYIAIQGNGSVNPSVSQLLMPPYQDPGVDTNHIIRCRYQLLDPDNITAFQILVRMVQSADSGGTYTPITGAELVITDVDHIEEGGWVVKEIILPEAVGANFANYDYLGYQIDASYTPSTGLPDTVHLVEAILAAGAWSQSNPDRDPIELINEQPTEYFKANIQDPVQGYFLALMEDTMRLMPGESGDWVVTVNAATESTRTATMHVRLLDGNEEIARTDEGTPPQISDTPSDVVLTAPFADVQNIENFDDIRVECTFEQDETQLYDYIRPDGTVLNEGYTAVGAPNVWEAVNEETLDKSDYAESPNDTNQARISYTLSAPDAGFGTADNVTVVVEVGGTPGNQRTPRLEVILQDGSGTKIQSKTVTISGDEQVKFKVNNPDEIDWNTARVQIRKTKESKAFGIRVYQVYVESGNLTEQEVQIYSIKLERDSIAGLRVASVEILIPLQGLSGPGDQALIYAGNEKSIYEVTRSGFVDVSKTQDQSYGAQVEKQGSWYFASWGQWVVATNGSDPVQVQQGLGERFVDLLDNDTLETEEPTARYCAVVNNFLWLANVKLANDTSGSFEQDTVWWSQINQPQVFKTLDRVGQSDWDKIVEAPGEITALTGGRHATVYKRNGIFRFRYSGYPAIFNKEVITVQEGTAYGRSVVPWGEGQFFFGAGGFRYLPPQGPPVPIGDGQVTKKFIDTLYEDEALWQGDLSDIRDLECTIVGTPDPWSQLIWWTYRGVNDEVFHNKLAVVYNPKEDRWSLIEDEGSLDACEILALPSVFQTRRTLTRNLIGMRYFDDSTKVFYLSAEKTMPASFRSTVMSSAFIGGERARGMSMTIHGIRPVYSSEGRQDRVNSRFRVEAAEDQALTCNVTRSNEVCVYEDMNDDGWMHFSFPPSGEFIRVEGEVPSLRNTILREIVGYELLVEMAGLEV